MTNERKGAWEKTAIVLQPIGGFMTALAVALVGIFGSQSINRRQAADTDARLYADLMIKREEADSSLRKDMFQAIIKTFLEPKSAGPGQNVLSLELLAYNFHESLDLSPLFKDVYRQIDPKAEFGPEYMKRLNKVALDVISRQIATLEEAGGKIDGDIVFDELEYKLTHDIPVLEGTLTMRSRDAEGLDPSLLERHFRVDALYVDRERKELRMKLKVNTPGAKGGQNAPGDIDDVDITFWVGFFDFPLVDNTRLARGQRCAIAFNSWSDSRASITLVYFPGSRASLKEKPFYDEVIDQLRRKTTFDKH